MPDIIVSGSGQGLQIPNVIGDLYAAFTFNAANPGPQTLVTGSPGYLLTRLFIEVDPTATIAAAGMVTVNWTDTTSGQIVGQARIFIPSVAGVPTTGQLASVASSGSGYWYRSRNAGSTCQVSLSTPLLTGSVRVAVNYAIIAQDT